MAFFRQTPALFLAPLFGACVVVGLSPDAFKSPEAPTTRLETKDRTVIEVDEYQKTSWVRGPEVTWWMKSAYVPCSAFLRALLDENRAVQFSQLYVSDSAWGWRWFDRAFDSDGSQLELIPIGNDTDVYGELSDYPRVYTTEQVGVTMTIGYLESHATTGIDIKLVGRSGERVVKLPPWYVEGFMDALESFTSSE